MNNLEVYKDFGRLARMLARHSVCKRRGVACVMLNNAMQVVAWGVNGPAHYDPNLCSGKKDGCGCAHSEINTILNTANSGVVVAAHECTMIVSRAPCVPCATAIVNCHLVGSVLYLDDSEPGADGLLVIKNCGIAVAHLDVPEGAEIGLRDPNMAPSKPVAFNIDGVTSGRVSGLPTGDIRCSNCNSVVCFNGDGEAYCPKCEPNAAAL